MHTFCYLGLGLTLCYWALNPLPLNITPQIHPSWITLQLQQATHLSLLKWSLIFVPESPSHPLSTSSTGRKELRGLSGPGAGDAKLDLFKNAG